MPDLIAIDLPGGPGFVDALRRVWERGDAAFPLDRRLSEPGKQQLLDAIGPAAIVGLDSTQRRDGRPVDTGDALVVATSGTTGSPRAVVLTHDALQAAAAATSSRLEVDPARDRWLACLPLAHMGGLGVVVRSLHTGTPVDVHDGFDAARVADSARSGSTLVSLVTALVAEIDGASFRRILLGGGPAPQASPPNAVVTYGMTETGGGVVYDGRPIDGVELRVVEDEIHVRGATLLRAYRDGSDPRDADGWFATGDLGRLGEDGSLTVMGRRGDMIITGGDNVWPPVVEQRLLAHPEVADVAVVGRPDPQWGLIVVAIIVPESSGRLPDLADLQAFTAEDLPSYMTPRRVEYAAHLPRTSIGKLRRHLL